MVSSADAVEIDGVNYYLDSWNKTASVVYHPNEYSGNVVIPETVTYQEKTYSVTTIENGAFRDCPNLTSITIPNSVTSIGESVFVGCSSLISVTIGNGVTSIGSLAFLGCSGLKKVIVPDIAAWCGISFSNSDSNPLYYAKHIYSDENIEIKDLVIPNSVTSIGYSAFENCSGLTSVTIPNSVTSIEGRPFYGCSGLTSISVENGNSKYDSRDNCNAIIETATNTLLYGCSNSNIPNSVTSIGGGAFSGCSGLTSVTIPNSVTSIGGGAFEGCSGLTSVTIPNSVTSIGEDAFKYCSGLTSVTIPNSVTSIGNYVFGGCSGLTSVTIPNSVTSIRVSAFSGCVSLTSITIPNSVTSIGVSAFSGCVSLTSITIPNSVTSIGARAFKGCNLSTITSLNPTPPTCSSNSFDKFTATLYVPQGSVLQYKAADCWRNFVIVREIATDNSIYLTINDGAKGSIKLRVNDANPYFTLKLEPDNGWQVSSLTLNGENVKAEMAEDGTYTTPAINSNSTLYVVYSQGASSVAAFHAEDYQLSAFGNTLTISGTEGGEQVSVYTIEGKNVTSLTADKGMTEIVVNYNQTYIVKVKDQVYKIRM